MTPPHDTTAPSEIADAERFAFGDNWQSFLAAVGPESVESATQALTSLLMSDDLRGKTFVDVGSGSGLSSLAARELGADVVSFDYDPASAAATRELKRRFRPDDSAWEIRTGSILDEDFLQSLGKFDIVYSWGVLHHTGAMRQAFENTQTLARPSSLLCIAIYNDQGPMSSVWRAAKHRYVAGSPATKRALELSAYVYLTLPSIAYRKATRKKLKPRRGMNRRRDLVDWIGGYPFEVATPQEVFAFYRSRGWQLDNLTTVGGRIGCNEFVFRRGANSVTLPDSDGPNSPMSGAPN